jgi:hypothetical protein
LKNHSKRKYLLYLQAHNPIIEIEEGADRVSNPLPGGKDRTSISPGPLPKNLAKFFGRGPGVTLDLRVITDLDLLISKK